VEHLLGAAAASRGARRYTATAAGRASTQLMGTGVGTGPSAALRQVRRLPLAALGLLALLIPGAAPGGPAQSAAQARAQARAILAERRFQKPQTPHPLRPLLHAIGDVVLPLVRWVGHHLFNWLPNSHSPLWWAIAAVVVGVAIFFVVRLIRKRVLVAEGGGVRGLPGREQRVDPARLEREAEAAEARGELELALRLRFRAGLLRLQRAKVVPARDSLTSGDVQRRLRLPEFNRVAAIFDEVVYGRRPVSAVDVAELQDGWQRILVKARAR
jgi:hypothetical protein